MFRADINWRLAVYGAGLIGGALWAVLAGTAFENQSSGSAASFEFSASQWWTAAGVTGAVLVAGIGAFVLTKSIVGRSIGIALIVSSLIGWFVTAGFSFWVL